MFVDMTPETIEARINSHFETAKHQVLANFRRVISEQAAKGARMSSATLLRQVQAMGEQLDALVTAGLQDVEAVEARGGDPAVLYDQLKTRVIQLKLWAMQEMLRKATWAGHSAGAGIDAEARRLNDAALSRIKHHLEGFDRKASSAATASSINITGSTHVIVQHGSPGASATLTVNAETVRQATDALESSVPWALLAQHEAEDLRAEIATIRAQLSKTSPNTFILREGGRTLRALAENIAATAAAPSVIAAVQLLWIGLGMGGG